MRNCVCERLRGLGYLASLLLRLRASLSAPRSPIAAEPTCVTFTMCKIRSTRCSYSYQSLISPNFGT